MEEEEYKYTRRRVNFYLNDEIESGYQHLLQLHGIEPSVENVRALARYHALQWHSVTQQEVSECFPIRGIMQYQKSINEILRLRNEVKAIREREYPDTKKYDEPVRVKLMRESGELQEVIQHLAEGVVNPDTGKPYDATDVLGELADCGYYNAQDYSENGDVRDFLAAQELFCKRASEALGFVVSVQVSLLLTIAKYTCRVKHAGLKQRDRKRAIALERDALSEVMELQGK